MKKAYIIVLIFIVLAVGTMLVLGAGKKAEAPVSEVQTVCTMEAKLCPGGSYVGRSGPKCEFAACPEVVN